MDMVTVKHGLLGGIIPLRVFCWNEHFTVKHMSDVSVISDMTGRRVPKVDLMQDDEDRNSPMSDIPLLLRASANVASDISALLTFTQAEDDLKRNVQSLRPIPSQTGVNTW